MKPRHATNAVVAVVFLAMLWIGSFAIDSNTAKAGTIPDADCSVVSTVASNEVNFALACDQPGWYNLLFGDTGNTHIESGDTKPHTFSCIDSIVEYTYTIETLEGVKLTTGTVMAGCSNELQQPDPEQPTLPVCTVGTTVSGNAANFALSCDQSGWYNLLFGDMGNTHIESGDTKPHTFSCIDSIVEYTYTIETLEGVKLTTGTVMAGCSNELQQPDPEQPEQNQRLYLPLVTH